MTIETGALPTSPLDPPAAAAGVAATQPYLWSVRRELWEYRSIFVAPLIAGAVVLFGFLISTFSLPYRMRAMGALGAAPQGLELIKPFGFSAMVVIVTGLIVGVFYCLGALHNERRDRSLLFWKSLPVSDLTTVLAKATVPMVVLPLVLFAVVLVMEVVMLLVSTEVLLLNNLSPVALWAHLPFFQMVLALFYGLVVASLWNAPIYAWLLLVSAWAKRAPFLWAVLAPLALCVLEHIAFRTSYLSSMVGSRLVGGFSHAFVGHAPGLGPAGDLPAIDVLQFLTTPGLWGGLIVAAAFLAGAVWMRRTRETL